ncbi:MAG: hypothetical protein ACXVP7_11125 [Actinomycetota bacterium]
MERLAARWRQISPGTTFSAGIAARGDRDEDVVARADAALYAAKRDGRDRIATDEQAVELHAKPA